MRTEILGMIVAAAVVGFSGVAKAALFTATNGSASVNITAVPSGPNVNLTIVLTNLTSATSTGSAGNLLTGLQLVPTDISGSGFSLTGQTGSQEFVFATQKTGSVSNGTFDPTWALTTSPAHALYFNGFGTGGLPIIGGPATGGTNYNNANASLTAGVHGTYIYETGTFTVQAPGSFNLNGITSVNFLFNTDGSIVVPGDTDGSIVVPGDPGSGSGVPEPASLGVLGLGAIGLLMRRRVG